MSEKVRDLVAVSLKNPVKIFISSNTDVAQGLEQQFVRIREGREGDREAIVAALLTRYFPKVLGLRFSDFSYCKKFCCFHRDVESG